MVLKLSYTLLILIWLCQWKQGVSELPSNLQFYSPSSSDDQVKESVIVGIPIPVERSESFHNAVNINNAAHLNSAVNLNNVFFLVRNPSQFPSAIEKLVTRIQNYFSNFNSLQSLTDRPRPTLSATDNNGTSIESQISNNNLLDSSIAESNDSSSSLRSNHLQDMQNIDRVDQEPDPVYTITIGPNIVYEPPQSYYPVPVSNSYLPAVEDSHLKEVYYRGSPESYHAPASSYIVPSSTLLPPLNAVPNQVQHGSGGYYYPLPCTSTTTSSPYLGPCVPQIDQTSTTEATYLPPYEPEIEVQGPFMIEPPKTPPNYPYSQESNAYPAQIPLCSQSTTPQVTPYKCNPSTTTPEPTTTTVAPCYTTTEKSTTTTVTPSSTTTAALKTPPVPLCQTTTTVAPTTTTTTTTTTEKPSTTTTTTTTTKAPCRSTTTATPTTKLPCHTTTEKTTTTTTKQPCQHSTTTTSTTPLCQHAKPSVTEPAWTYLPPQKPTNSPNIQLNPVTSRKPLYYLPPQDNTYQAANQINNNYYRPLFRSHPKFLYRLKRLFGLA